MITIHKIPDPPGRYKAVIIELPFNGVPKELEGIEIYLFQGCGDMRKRIKAAQYLKKLIEQANKD